ncbi:MAG: autotransporter-associated beta strand repeat-containing protein, partial [Campylobacteraceae bacterium]
MQDPFRGEVGSYLTQYLTFIKNGTGIWKLGGNNTITGDATFYSSNLTVNAGTLYLYGESDNSSAGAGNITLNSASPGYTSSFNLMSNASLIAGGDNVIKVVSNAYGGSYSTATSSFYDNSTISGGSGNTSLHVNSSNGNFIYGLVNLNANNTQDNFTLISSLNGTGGINKIGEGRVILIEDNYYNGSTLINEGSLRVTNLNSINASSNVTINNQATLELFTGDNTTFTN